MRSFHPIRHQMGRMLSECSFLVPITLTTDNGYFGKDSPKSSSGTNHHPTLWLYGALCCLYCEHAAMGPSEPFKLVTQLPLRQESQNHLIPFLQHGRCLVRLTRTRTHHTTSHHITSSRHTTSRHVTPRHATPHDIMSHHATPPPHHTITPHHITPHHTTHTQTLTLHSHCEGSH